MASQYTMSAAFLRRCGTLAIMPEPSGIFLRIIFSGRNLPFSMSFALSCCASATSTMPQAEGAHLQAHRF